MIRRKYVLLWPILALLTLALGPTAQAQNNAPAATGQATSATPAVANPPSAANSSAPAPAAKKVWTNEDMGDLHSGSTISTFQNKSASQNGAARKPATSVKNGNANWYHAQITKLQAQIPPLDAKIAQLQAAIAGHSINDPKTSSRPYGGVKPGDWQMQVNQYQQNREGLLAKISALQDQARHAGVPDNDIP
ncbi:MAG: hypothetical protein ACRD52_17420 [Candidatus Acidiferrales bacterium]